MAATPLRCFGAASAAARQHWMACTNASPISRLSTAGLLRASLLLLPTTLVWGAAGTFFRPANPDESGRRGAADGVRTASIAAYAPVPPVLQRTPESVGSPRLPSHAEMILS